MSSKSMDRAVPVAVVLAVTRSPRPDCLQEKRTSTTDRIAVSGDREQFPGPRIDLDLDDQAIFDAAGGSGEVCGEDAHAGSILLRSGMASGWMPRVFTNLAGTMTARG